MKEYINLLHRVKSEVPLIQCITNFVTVNDCANIILASGGTPAMCKDIREVEEFVCNASALVCNMGAIDLVDSMILAGRKANNIGKPVVLDPVAVGATKLRRDMSKLLLDKVSFSVIRGNASEIRFLAGQKTIGSGVDVNNNDIITETNLIDTIDTAKNLAKQINTVIAVSGVIDIVTDGTRTIILRNGCDTMSKITGSGCMLTSLIGTFCAVSPEEPFISTVYAMAIMGVAGEFAEKKRLKNSTGNATFRTDLIDEVFNMTEEKLMEAIRYEVY